MAGDISGRGGKDNSSAESGRSPRSTESVASKVGCLTIIAGAVIGFVAGLIWANGQKYTYGPGTVLKGENRAMLVGGLATMGAFCGVLLAMLIASVRALWLHRSRKNAVVLGVVVVIGILFLYFGRPFHVGGKFIQVE